MPQLPCKIPVKLPPWPPVCVQLFSRVSGTLLAMVLLLFVFYSCAFAECRSQRILKPFFVFKLDIWFIVGGCALVDAPVCAGVGLCPSCLVVLFTDETEYEYSGSEEEEEEVPEQEGEPSSIVNVPGESTLRRDFLRLQQENKERSEALRRQQLLQEQQLREQEEYKRQLLAERQKRIEQQKEQRRRLEEQQRREREARRQQDREQRRREQEEKRRLEDAERRRAEEEKRRVEREQEYIRRQLEEEQRHLELLQQQLLQEQAVLLVPVRTTSRSPVLSRRDSPLQGSGQQNSQAGQRNSTSSIEPRLLWERVEKLVPRPGSGSSSGSSNSGSQPGSHPGSQSGSGERFRVRSDVRVHGGAACLQPHALTFLSPHTKGLAHEGGRIWMDLTALAKELRAVEDVRPPHKVTDYSSSSEESGTTDEEDDDVEQEGAEEPGSGPEDPRAASSLNLSNGETESVKTMIVHDDVESEPAMTPSKEGTLIVRQKESEYSSSCEEQARITCVQGRLRHQVWCVSVGFSCDGMRPEAIRQDPTRKGSVVNVNPTNTRPQSDTPEIRKYKKRFNSEILCAALWGVNLLVGTESGLMLLDRSGQGKVYPLINRRRFQQMDVLEGLNVLVTISGLFRAKEVFFAIDGKKDKLRVYYLSWLRNKILHNDPEVEKKQGWTTVGDLEGCVHYKVVKYERIKFLVIALKSSVEVYAWAPKPYHKFMAFKSFGELVHKPLLVDLTVEEGQRLKVIYGSCAGFHAVDVDSGSVYDIYLPTHIQCSIKPHAIIILPNTDGMELLVCYEDEGVYVNTYGRITKDVVLQWGEMPTSVAYIRSNQTMGWGEKAIEIRSVETGHLDGVFMHKRAQRLKFLCERNDKVFFASVRSGGSSQVYFMTLGRTSLLSWASISVVEPGSAVRLPRVTETGAKYIRSRLQKQRVVTSQKCQDGKITKEKYYDDIIKYGALEAISAMPFKAEPQGTPGFGQSFAIREEVGICRVDPITQDGFLALNQVMYLLLCGAGVWVARLLLEQESLTWKREVAVTPPQQGGFT
ncbi:hypothetical protein CB1_000949008 [Camelus ferus]|nr:hypothetical protein CB1_000949008 [Camelus ferus]